MVAAPTRSYLASPLFNSEVPRDISPPPVTTSPKSPIVVLIAVIGRSNYTKVNARRRPRALLLNNQSQNVFCVRQFPAIGPFPIGGKAVNIGKSGESRGAMTPMSAKASG